MDTLAGLYSEPEQIETKLYRYFSALVQVIFPLLPLGWLVSSIVQGEVIASVLAATATVTFAMYCWPLPVAKLVKFDAPGGKLVVRTTVREHEVLFDEIKSVWLMSFPRGPFVQLLVSTTHRHGPFRVRYMLVGDGHNRLKDRFRAVLPREKRVM